MLDHLFQPWSRSQWLKSIISTLSELDGLWDCEKFGGLVYYRKSQFIWFDHEAGLPLSLLFYNIRLSALLAFDMIGLIACCLQPTAVMLPAMFIEGKAL